MKNTKLLFILLQFLSCLVTLSATHQTGAFLRYQITPQNNKNFQIEGDLFFTRDPHSGGASFDYILDVAVFKRTQQAWVFVKNVTVQNPFVKTFQQDLTNQICPSRLLMTASEQARYTFKFELPQINTEYMLVYQRCCRVQNLINIENSDFGGSTLYLIISPLGQKTAHSGAEYDLDRFWGIKTSKPNRFTLINHMNPDQPVRLTFGTPIQGGGRAGSIGYPGSAQNCNGVTPNLSNCPPPYPTVVYKTGFSYDKPLGLFGTTELDSSTGVLDVQAEILGNFLMCFEVEINDVSNQSLSRSNLEFTITTFVEELPLYDFRGLRFWDKNQNGLKDQEEPQFKFPIKISNEYCFYEDNNDGSVRLNLFTGKQYEIESSSPLWYISKTPEHKFHIYSDHSDTLVQAEIPFLPNEAIPHAELFGFLSLVRCNEETEFDLHLVNSGTLSLTGTLQIQLDSKLQFIGLNYPYILRNNTYFIDINKLDPLMTIDPIRFKLRMPSEEHQGEVLSIFSEFVTPEYSVHYSYNNLVSCSYDPNAKSSVPNDGISGRLEGFQPIIYTVDFENLGNDTAKKVVVRDKISLDHELSSFEFLESSHPCKHFITAHREIWFVFDPIHLPPSSTDSIKGRGQLKFKLTPANHLQNWDIVTNTAQIFFDKNAPIVTNETHNLFNHYNTRNQSEEIIRNAYLSYTKIFPQPFANKIKVEIPYFYWLKDELSWKLYNSLGMYVTEGVFSHTVNEIELFHLTDGLYWLIIDYNGKWSQTKKLIKITD